jgi:hypothetical protein
MPFFVPVFVDFEICKTDLIPELEMPGVYMDEKDAVYALLEVLCEQELLYKSSFETEEEEDDDYETYTYDKMVSYTLKNNIQLNTEEDLQKFLSGHCLYNECWTFYIKKYNQTK